MSIGGWASNSIKVSLPMSVWRDARKGIKLPLTNFPFGAVLFTNGIPAFTNLPHLTLALDTPDFGSTNQFNLTNDFISLTSNCVNISEITALLAIPWDRPTPEPTLRMWILNDSEICVTNIEVVITSMFGFEFATNELWHAREPAAHGDFGSVGARCESLPPGRSIMIPPISLRPTIRVGEFGWMHGGAVGICVNANDMAQQFKGFWLTFIPSNILSRPVFSRVAAPAVASSNGIPILLLQFPEAFIEVKGAGPKGRN
jgi:hypothetical protein